MDPVRDDGLLVSDFRDDLRATTDSVVRDAERLIAVEREKEAAAGTPRGEALEVEARRLTASLARKVRAEADLTDRIARQRR